MTDRPAGPSPRWAAVVINHNSGELLHRCVSSVRASGGAAGVPELVVVDNASNDGSAQALRAAVPEVVVIAAPTNLGYARAANLGTAATTAPIVAVLNPDTVVEPGTGEVLVNRLEREPELAAVGPRIVDPDGSLYPSARSVPSTVDAVGHGVLGLVRPDNPFTRRYRQTSCDPHSPRDVDWVSGSAIWLRRCALDAVGGWDERYFMYVEDVDLCWRLRGAGWRVAFEPSGTVEHVQGASTSRHPYRMLVEHHRSLWRFAARRWQGPKRALLVPAGGFLAIRAILAMAAHAGHKRRGRRPPSG